MSIRHLLLLLPLLGLFACAGPKAAPAPTPITNRLTVLMVERLAIAREVAWLKFQNDLPVKDPKRESELLARLVAQGNALGLSPAVTEAFFEAQIRASCTVQEELIRGWKRGDTLPAFAPKDLVRDIRPRLDTISQQMLEELALLEKDSRNQPTASMVLHALRDHGFSWRVAWEATAPLR